MNFCSFVVLITFSFHSFTISNDYYIGNIIISCVSRRSRERMIFAVFDQVTQPYYQHGTTLMIVSLFTQQLFSVLYYAVLNKQTLNKHIDKNKQSHMYCTSFQHQCSYLTSGHRTISGQKLQLCNLRCACSVKLSCHAMKHSKQLQK